MTPMIMNGKVMGDGEAGGNYIKAIAKYIEEHEEVANGSFVAHIYHDGWCSFFTGAGCNCAPDVRMEKL